MAPIVLLCVLGLSGAFLAPAKHACRLGSEYFLSNCCSDDEILACFPGGCLVAVGCTICSGTCWDLFRPGVATRPGAKAGELVGQLGWAVRPLVTGAYVASVLGLGEPFSAALLAGGVLSRQHHGLPNHTCVMRCDMVFQSELWQVWEDVKDSLWTFEWLLELPWHLWVGVTACGPVVLGVVVLLALEQRLVMALMVVLLSGVALGVYTPPVASSCNCTVTVLSPPQHRIRPGYRGNGTNICDCAFGKMYWLPGFCHGIIWGDQVKVSTMTKFPVLCPAYLLGSSSHSVACRWGSAYWHFQLGRGVRLLESVPTSALCHIYAKGSTDRPHPLTDVLGSLGVPCASCIIDRRGSWCGSCVRDCWPDTASRRLTFEFCGIGDRLTEHLVAHSVKGGIESIVSTPAGERPRFKSYHTGGTTFPAEYKCELNYTVSEIGGYWHAIAYPSHLAPAALPRFLPGRPVNACITSKKDTSLIYGAFAPGGFYAPVFTKCNWPPVSGVYVCPGYAYDFPGGRAGMIRVIAGHQQVAAASGLPHPKWLLTDFLFVMIMLMKLSEARLVPLATLAVWWWFNQVAEGATIRVVYPVVTGPTEEPPPTWTIPALPTFACAKNASLPGEAVVMALCKVANAGSGAADAAVKTVNHGLLWTWRHAWNAWQQSSSFARGLAWLLDKGRYLPVAEAAVSPDVIAAPLVGWAAEQGWFTGVLALLNVLVYWSNVGGARLAALVAGHLARGALPLVLVVAASISRSRCSVLGLRVCFELSSSPWTITDVWWCLAGVVSWAFLTGGLLTHLGRDWKLSVYAGWCRFYQGLRRRIADSPVGTCGRRAWLGWLWLAAAWFWPGPVVDVVVVIMLSLGLVDVLDYALEVCLVTTANPARVARALEAMVASGDTALVRWFVSRLERRGVTLFAHMGQVTRTSAAKLRDWGFALEPVAVTPRDCEIVRDAARTLSCGCLVGGRPVVARRGDEVLIGAVASVEELPPGFVPTAPVVVHARGKGFLQVVKTSMTGKDEDEHNGAIVVLGTSTTRSMGTCVSGLMYTTYHGSTARTLAGPVGRVNPRWWSTSDDVCVYPLPNGAGCLEPCKCQPQSVWCIRNDGALCHGTLGKTVELDLPAEVADFRGSSGSPILCDQGHAVGMMVSVLHKGNRVTGVRFTKPWETLPQEARSKTEPPPVPGKTGYKEAPLFLPTGSGKSTKVPNEYAKAGHKVLVLNPSIATTRAMGPYMEKLTGKHPSVYCGHDDTAYSRTTDSNLTYCTYGRFLANPRKYLRGKDVVICDECHVTDPIAILGMGRARLLARECKVKLLLFATATPPGSPMTPHDSIREETLGAEGEVVFYGHKLPVKRYSTGRHIIFCHSKAECNKLDAALSAAGCNSMTYYRGGENPIPDGDICVCATDALSTGYTGNFDTVTDCGLVVEEVVEVTLDPTITISLRTVPAPAELRMQRRGRCGRGKAGVYYHALVGSAPAGTVRSGALWSAVEAGIVWYNMEPDLTADLLRAYDQCPYTGAVSANIGEAVSFFAGLVPMRSFPEVAWAKQKNHSWPLLVGCQRHMCKDADCGPPAEGPEWRGLKGTGAVPLLCRWGAQVPDKVAPHHWVDDLQARLGAAEGYSPCYAGPILLIGLAVAGGAVLAHWTGSLVVVTSWTVNGGGNPLLWSQSGGVADSAPLPAVLLPPKDGRPADEGEMAPAEAKINLEAVEALETACGWGPMAASFAQVGEVAGSVATAATHAAKTAARHADVMWQQWANGSFVPPPQAAREVAPSLLQTLDQTFSSIWDKIFTNGRSLLVAFAAAYGARKNPPLGVGASFLMGMASTAQLPVRLAAALLVGTAGTMVGTPNTGISMASAYFAGSSMSTSCLAVIISVIGGWEGAVNAASLTFDLLTGKATTQDAWYVLACLGSPGAAVAGVALGLLLWAAKRGVSDAWVNRLLTLLPRSSVIPDDYFVKTEYVEKVSQVLRKLSMTRWVSALVASPAIDGETQCSSLIWDFIDWLLRLGRLVTRKIKTIIPALSVPLASCEAGWKGPWVGEGHLEARCACGCVVTGDVAGGELRDVRYSSWFCGHFLRGSVPVSVMGSAGCAHPKPPEGGPTRRVYQVGVKDWIEVTDGYKSVVLLASSSYSVSKREVRRAVRGPVMYCDGAPVSWECPVNPPAMVYRKGQAITVDGERVTLPTSVSCYPPGSPALQPPVAARGTPEEEDEMPPLEGECDDDEDILSARERAVEAIAETLHLPNEDEARAALEALEEAAVILAPHVGTIMGDDCSCREEEEFLGAFFAEPETTEIPILPNCSPTPDDQPIPEEPPLEELSFGSSTESPGELSLRSSSFETINLSDSEESTTSESAVLLQVKRALPKGVRALGGKIFGGTRRTVAIKQSCCTSRSCFKSFPMEVSVGEAARAMGFDLEGHAMVDVFGGVISPDDTLCTVVGTNIIVTCEHREEVTVSYSYVWSGAPLGCGRHVPPPMTRPIGTHLTCDTTKVYVTDPDRAAERAEKVTLWREPRKYDDTYQGVVAEALKAAKSTKSHGWTYEEAVQKVRSKASTGYGCSITVKDLQTPRGRAAVERMMSKIERGEEVPFTFMTKREVFFASQDNHKGKRKPPRFIVYPPLDFRVAEKMILGDPGKVAKAVLGPAYGFQYTPNQKVRRLVDVWQHKQHPRAITVDASCFDSTITEEDINLEAKIFAAASDRPELVMKLSEYYAAGPMVSPTGVPVGYRRCRSSGVLTTSSGNSITCYLKVKAACIRAGIKEPTFMICGDDCLIIYEDDGEDHCPALKSALNDYGYRCDPQMHASLDTAETCSSYLAECTAGDHKRHWFMSCDMRKPLARAASEYSDPIASALGTVLLYPWHPISRYVLLPHLLIYAFRGGGTVDELIACEVQGNTYRFPLKLLPQVLVSLHGPDCLRVLTDSTKTRMESGKALRELGMRSLAYYRKRAGTVRTRLLRGGPGWGKLARALLWHPGLKEHPPDLRSLPHFRLTTPYDHQEVIVAVEKINPWSIFRTFIAWIGILACALI
uniref:Genome polyprotein n=5 Tax=Bat pegivirus TaxID=1112699 RepID=M9ZRW9_9FLAV|nr:polyprotein [Bat pegivirus]